MAKRKKNQLKALASPEAAASDVATTDLTKAPVAETATPTAEAAASVAEAVAPVAEAAATAVETAAPVADAVAPAAETTAPAVETATPAAEAAATAAETAAPVAEAATSAAKSRESSKSVISMALIASVLIAAIGCWGYFVTPKLGKQPSEPQQRVVTQPHKTAQGEIVDKSKRPPAAKKPTGPKSEERQDEPIDEVKLSDQELALLEPPIYRQVSNPSLQKDIIVSQYMYARDYLSFAGIDVSYIDKLDKQAQEAAQSGNGADDLLVKQAAETSAKMLQQFFSAKFKTSKIKDKEKLAQEAERCFQRGDLGKGITIYEKACGLEKKAQTARLSK